MSGVQPSPSSSPGARILIATPVAMRSDRQDACEPEGVPDDARQESRLSRDEVRIGARDAQASYLDEKEDEAVGDRERSLAGRAELPSDHDGRQETENERRRLASEGDEDVRSKPRGLCGRKEHLRFHLSHRRRAV